MKLLIILLTLLASISTFAIEDKFMVLQHRTKDSNSTVAKVRITFDFYQKRDLHIACVYKDKKTIFYIAVAQLSYIFNSASGEREQARWVFDFSDLDQVSAQLVDGGNIFDMENGLMYDRWRNHNEPALKDVPEIPISQPSKLQFINDFACIVRKTPESNN